MRGAWLAVLFLGALTASCGEVTDVAWDFRLASGLVDVERLRASIHDDACDGPAIFEAEFARGGVAPTPPILDPEGTYGFSIVAHDARCVIVGRGCTLVSLPALGPDDAVVVDVRAAAAQPACGDAMPRCVDGRCVP